MNHCAVESERIPLVRLLSVENPAPEGNVNVA